MATLATDTPATTTPKRAVIHRMMLPDHLCPSGLKAVDLLRRHGFEVEDHPLRTREATEAFKAAHGVKTTPQVWIDEVRVGGHDDLRRHLGLAVHDPKALTYKPVVAIFGMAAALAGAVAWGGPMACSANLFPQIGTLSGRPNAFYVQGYSGFGVTPSHIVCKVLAEGMSEGSARYDLMARIPHVSILGTDHARPAVTTAAKCWHQLSGYFNGRR